MEKLTLDTGIKEYQINDGVLRFNPADPNVYARFTEIQSRLSEIERERTDRLSKINTDDMDGVEIGKIVVETLRDLDAELKELLSRTFGGAKEDGANNFDDILCGVSMFAFTSTGRQVVEELMDLLQPIMDEGLNLIAAKKASAAVKQAEQARAQREAAQE